MKNNILQDKSYSFAIEIVKVSQKLISEKREFILSKQILRSGTAIGALIREAEFAQSKLDFIHKMSIALKEANETLYWLSLLKDTFFIEEVVFNQLSNYCRELIALLVTIVKTSKANT